MASVRASMIPMLRLWGRLGAAGARRVPGQSPGTAPPGPAAYSAPTGLPEVDGRPPLAVVIGVSTGGPVALSALLPALPADLGVPVVVVQHMPPVFTKLLAERLDTVCPLSVVEVTDGMTLAPNRVHIAAGGFHLELTRHGPLEQVTLTSDPPENSCRPAVDVTLRAAHRLWGSRTLTVILTGMGNDGLRGVESLRRAGGRVLVQDADTSVVWGMPGAVARAGLADAVLPLPQIAPAIVSAVRNGRAMAAAARVGVAR
jgi:two-component system chemotaxis response regulator CheB